MTKPIKISPDLLSDFRSNPQQRQQVLIICDGNIDQIKLNLEKIGIEITGELNELQILNANIDSDDLTKLQNIAGIEWIEIDDEAQAYQ